MTGDPAADLREAAALMRERALAATQGRWHHLCMGSEGCSVINDGHLRDRKHVAFFGRKEWKADHADACYVAGMPPAVSLAVADWLDATAREAGEFLSLDSPEGPCCEVLPACEGHGSIWGCERCGEFIGGGCTCWDGALKTARTYLGREDA